MTLEIAEATDNERCHGGNHRVHCEHLHLAATAMYEHGSCLDYHHTHRREGGEYRCDVEPPGEYQASGCGDLGSPSTNRPPGVRALAA
jgi:hypothetical protein